MSDKWGSYTYGEGTTDIGQMVSFQAKDSKDIEKFKKALKLVRTVSFPDTHKSNSPHGGYGRYSRYNLKQHKYAGGGHPGNGGIVELLEVLDAPVDRNRYIAHCTHEYEYTSNDCFIAFESLATLLESFNFLLSSKFNFKKSECKELKGFVRYVDCGEFTPWFYAVGDQLLWKDFAFPDKWANHPVYRPFRKFVVRPKTEYSEVPVEIKVCSGAYDYGYKEHSSWQHESDVKPEQRTVVLFDDGTRVTLPNYSTIIEPLEADRLWIHKAVCDFKRLLSGAVQRFEIPFLNGDRFVGHMVINPKRPNNYKGKYTIQVRYKKGGKESVTSGKLNFIPTQDLPTIEKRVKKEAADKGVEVMEIISCVRVDKNGSWKGVF